jgi:hypothetical protein
MRSFVSWVYLIFLLTVVKRWIRSMVVQKGRSCGLWLIFLVLSVLDALFLY